MAIRDGSVFYLFFFSLLSDVVLEYRETDSELHETSSPLPETWSGSAKTCLATASIDF